MIREIQTGVLLLVVFVVASLILVVDANVRCDFIANAPVVETTIPSFQYSLKFLENIDATVYRSTSSAGSLPKIKILRYSASPFIDIDSVTKEVFLSTSGSDCAKTSDGTVKKFHSKLGLLSTATLGFALSNGGGLSGSWTSFLFSTSLLLWYTGGIGMADAAERCAPTMEILIEAPPYYKGSVEECLAEVENPDHCPTDFPQFPTCTDLNPSIKYTTL